MKKTLFILAKSLNAQTFQKIGDKAMIVPERKLKSILIVRVTKCKNVFARKEKVFLLSHFRKAEKLFSKTPWLRSCFNGSRG